MHYVTWAAEQQRARTAALAPRFPHALDYLHTWFLDLSARRTVSMGGIAPISDEQIRAWRENEDERPLPHEVRAIFALDRAWRTVLFRPEETAPLVPSPQAANPATRDNAQRLRGTLRGSDAAWPTKRAETSASSEVM